MTENRAEQASTTPSIFSPEDSRESLWIKAYQGEVLGEILFARLAEQLDDADQARKMRVLSTMERVTKEALVAPLGRAGISTEPDPETVATAEGFADALAQVSWFDLVSSFEPVTAQYAALYAHIGELDPSEQATADLLVAHELALRSFGRLEASGNGEESLNEVMALPHMAH
jgi:murein L,D-transpeptidase YcbB/YkuD